MMGLNSCEEERVERRGKRGATRERGSGGKISRSERVSEERDERIKLRLEAGLSWLLSIGCLLLEDRRLKIFSRSFSLHGSRFAWGSLDTPSN
jgi:hypothetical protein